MTNYLGTAQIQQLSIAITSGNTTGTATVTSPSGNGALIFLGNTATDTGQINDSFCRVSRSGTTVTATRGASGSSQSTAVKCVLIDGNSSLFDTVQEGTIAMTTGVSSNTATLGTNPTDGDTADNWIGTSDTTSSTSWSNNHSVITRSGTTVTATKQFAGTAVTVGYSIVEHASGVLNSSSQKISSTATPSASTRDVTITSVTTANTVLFFSGMYGNSGASGAVTFQKGELTSSTNIRITTNSNSFVSIRYTCVVAEYASGVLAANVQRGSISVSGATSNTATITSSSTTEGFASFAWHTTNATTMNPATSMGNLEQTNATTVTAAFNSSSTGSFSYEVARYAVTADTSVGGGWNPYYRMLASIGSGFNV